MRCRAKLAQTAFTLKQITNTKDLVLYEAQLLTGRTHQLRVQFSDAGAPILADPYYNPFFVEYLSKQTLNGDTHSTAPFGCALPTDMGLQAHSIQFTHSVHGAKETVSLRLPLPARWKYLLESSGETSAKTPK